MRFARQSIAGCALLFGVFAAELAWTAEFDWELKRDREGIQVYTSAVEGSKHKAVRATMEVETSIAELVALVLDTEACPDWAALCKESYVADRVSPTDFHVYTYNDLPWPVKDRDAVARVQWQTQADGTVVMTADIASGVVDETRSAIRLREGTTSWTFAPAGENRVAVTSFAHLDPAGATPAWLTNMLLVDSPYDTMANMRSVVTSGRYADADIEFLTE